MIFWTKSCHNFNLGWISCHDSVTMSLDKNDTVKYCGKAELAVLIMLVCLKISWFPPIVSQFRKSQFETNLKFCVKLLYFQPLLSYYSDQIELVSLCDCLSQQSKATMKTTCVRLFYTTGHGFSTEILLQHLLLFDSRLEILWVPLSNFSMRTGV